MCEGKDAGVRPRLLSRQAVQSETIVSQHCVHALQINTRPFFSFFFTVKDVTGKSLFFQHFFLLLPNPPSLPLPRLCLRPAHRVSRYAMAATRPRRGAQVQPVERVAARSGQTASAAWHFKVVTRGWRPVPHRPCTATAASSAVSSENKALALPRPAPRIQNAAETPNKSHAHIPPKHNAQREDACHYGHHSAGQKC